MYKICINWSELITLIRTKVKGQIIEEVKIAKYFSVIFDYIPDVSHQEQMSQILRYVKVVNGNVSMEERFIDFIHSHEKIGSGLANEILQKLKVNGLQMFEGRVMIMELIWMENTKAFKL